MKKSLLIILSLIFMNMTAFAVGVDCWEEISSTHDPETVSKMQTILGNNAEIVRVKTVLSVAHINSNYGLTQAYLPLEKYVYYLAKGTTSKPYYLYSENYQPTASSSSVRYGYSGGVRFDDGKLVLGIQDSYADFKQTSTDGGDTSTVKRYLYRVTSGSSTSSYNWYGGYSYIHTYCIENTNSGGGGGSSGAAVNYIIKAD